MGTISRNILDALNNVLSARGLEIHPKWRLERLPQARYLRRLFREWDVSSVIDVGANAGQYTDFLRSEVGFTGPILSFEPQPELAKRLAERSAESSIWRTEGVALGAEHGTIEFRIAKNSEFGSVLPAKAFSEEYFGAMSSTTQVIDVEVRTLDDMIDAHRDFLGDRIYLKLDTQGFDLHVLSGLRRHDSSVVAAQSECAVIPLYEGAPEYYESIEAFRQRGFIVSQFFPNNDGHFPRLIEFDSHFVRLPRSDSSDIKSSTTDH
jgi:FkbM family methyltransferase